MTFPEHKCGLSLEHNMHKNYYETLVKWEENLIACYNDYPVEWVSEEQRTKALAFDNVWVLQWYPHTPIGFCRLLACDLDVLLKAANEG